MLCYWGIFFMSLSILSFEISLVRLFSITTWYHLAFFAISVAMLGMTAGANKVFLSFQNIESDKFNLILVNAAIKYSISIPIVLIFLCIIPMGFYGSVLTLFTILITTTISIIPFYYAGIVVTIMLTKKSLPIGKLYAMDLIGASSGCLLVLLGLELFDTPSFIILIAAVGAFSAYLFSISINNNIYKKRILLLIIIFSLLAVLNANYSQGIRPLIIKGQKIESASSLILERWNSYSRVAVYPLEENVFPQMWGVSPSTPHFLTDQYFINIDGEAGTVIRKFKKLDDLEHLKFDVTSIAYYLQKKGKVCIIGVGGGKDVESALLFGNNYIVGLEYNPIFIDLLNNEFKEFAGISKYSNIKLVSTEARNYLSSSNEKYQMIQMSLIDTWAATGAGAFSLSENSLYTVEAWKVFFSRLDSVGIFTVSRWHSSENIGETGRIVSLATKTLLDIGISNPSKHIVLISSKNISTLIVSKCPFSSQDINLLNEAVNYLRFNFVIHPLYGAKNYLLGKIVSARSDSDLILAISKSKLNFSPPTDENPYFFNMLKLNNIYSYLINNNLNDGVIGGNLLATALLVILLICLLIISLITILIPIAVKLKKRQINNIINDGAIFGAFYFILIGSGFMLTEIALIQRLTILLTHPIYALGVLLFGIIVSTGIGSYISDKLNLNKKYNLFIISIVTSLLLIILPHILNLLSNNLMTSGLDIKISYSLLVIFPVGIMLGMFFPSGIRITKNRFFNELPWFWALNGVFGVFCSVLAIFISIYFGISWNFYLASFLYFLTIISIRKITISFR